MEKPNLIVVICSGRAKLLSLSLKKMNLGLDCHFSWAFMKYTFYHYSRFFPSFSFSDLIFPILLYYSQLLAHVIYDGEMICFTENEHEASRYSRAKPTCPKVLTQDRALTTFFFSTVRRVPERFLFFRFLSHLLNLQALFGRLKRSKLKATSCHRATTTWREGYWMQKIKLVFPQMGSMK